LKIEIEASSVKLPTTTIDVGYPVLDARTINGFVVVLCDWMAFPRGVPARNLFAYTYEGALLWRAADIGWGATDAYTAITSEEPLVAFNFACFSCTIDPTTGQVQQQRFTK